MINRKAGVNVKISDVFRKRALFGVAIFCITAIATVGALSMGGNKEDDTPDSLVDLNETENPGDSQVADIPDDTKDPEVQDPSQVAEVPDDAKDPKVQDPSQVAEVPDDTKNPEVQDPSQVAETSEETDQTEVLSPQLIA